MPHMEFEVTEEDKQRRDKNDMIWNRQWAIEQSISLLKLHAENNRDIVFTGINETVVIKVADAFLEYISK